MRTVLEINDNKAISCNTFGDEAAAQEHFEALVREYGVEPTDELYDGTGQALFQTEDDFTIQLVITRMF